MKMKLRALLLPAILAMTFPLLHAETRITPAVIVQVIQTEKPDEYLNLLAKSNVRIKTLTGIDQLRRAWRGDFAGQDSHSLVVTSTYNSAAAGVHVADKIAQDAEMSGLLREFAGIRKLGPSYLMKGVRWEGVHAGGAVLNTSISLSDEPAYLKLLDDLRVLFDANGFKDAKLNLLRIMAGRENSTHLVVISLPSQVRVAELIDATTDTALLKDWNAAAGKIRTTVHNGTYHEVTK